MADCFKYQELISCYIDGEISEKEKADFLEHIETCPSCAALLESYKSLFSEAPADIADAPDELVSNVMAAIHQKEIPYITIPAPKAADTEKKNNKIWVKYIGLAACLAVVIFAVPHFFSMGKSAPASNGAATDSKGDAYVSAESSPDSSSDGSFEEFDAPASDNYSDVIEDAIPDEIPADTPADEPADAPAADAPSPEPESSVVGTIYISGTLPEILASYSQIDLGDGTFLITVSADTAASLMAQGYEAVYTDPAVTEGDFDIIFTPQQ